MREPVRNIGASVRARLLDIARERNQVFDLVLTRYALERLLYRLSTTRYRERFVLKGAMLISTWFDAPFRPTRDLDLLAFGDSDGATVLGVFREICTLDNKDGVVFDVAGLDVRSVGEQREYSGLRVETTAMIGGARIAIKIDIGFGDAIEPAVVELELPVLLDLPRPRLRAYPRESVIAEKFQAMVLLGRANSRMKDLYDIWVLSRAFEFSGDSLARAIAATFVRRRTPIPTELPDALTPAFANDAAKQRQWSSFVEGIEIEPTPLISVIDDLAAFIMPHASAARHVEIAEDGAGH